MRSPQVSYWKEAIAKELAGLTALITWSLVLLSSMPAGSNLMNCHFVFDVKRKKSGEVLKFKARLVADGNTQKHGCDFDRVSRHTPSLEIWRCTSQPIVYTCNAIHGTMAAIDIASQTQPHRLKLWGMSPLLRAWNRLPGPFGTSPWPR